MRVLLMSFRFTFSDSMLDCSTMTRTVEQQTGEIQNPIPWKLLWRLGCRFSAKSYPQVIVPWIRQVVNINFFQCLSRTSYKLWTSEETSAEVEEWGSFGKTWDKCVHLQHIIHPTSKRIIYISTPCQTKKSLMSLPST